MNSENYCGLNEHKKSIGICLIDQCNEKSRFICKLCNTIHYHSHNQANSGHKIDYEQIIKIQENLKEQQQQYHFHSHKIKQILKQLEQCKYEIQKLEEQLQKYAKYYDTYLENLFAIQNYFSQRIDFNQETNSIAKIIKEVQNYDHGKFQKIFHQLSQNIIQKFNESTKYMFDLQVIGQQDQMLKLVNYQQQEIHFSQITQDGKHLYYGSSQALSYDIIEQVSQPILVNLNHDILSFQISKTEKLFYMGDFGGNLRVYDKNRRKGVQFHMQKQEITDIKVISKNIIILIYDNLQEQQQVQVVNIKLNKIIYIMKFLNPIQQIIYSDIDNFLIVVQHFCVDVITINSKLKRQAQIDHENIRTVHYNKKCQQLIMLDQNWYLTFYDLEFGQFKKSHVSNQINLFTRGISNFTFNEIFQLLIILTDGEIIIRNIQGQIIKIVNCNYDTNLVDLSSQGEFIVLRALKSISLLKLDNN